MAIPDRPIFGLPPFGLPPGLPAGVPSPPPAPVAGGPPSGNLMQQMYAHPQITKLTQQMGPDSLLSKLIAMLQGGQIPDGNWAMGQMPGAGQATVGGPPPAFPALPQLPGVPAPAAPSVSQPVTAPGFPIMQGLFGGGALGGGIGDGSPPPVAPGVAPAQPSFMSYLTSLGRTQ